MAGLGPVRLPDRRQKTHDELDAVTSALVGHFYLADQYEAIGADDEGYMIIPRSAIAWPNGGGTAGARRPTAFLIGLPGAGKTTLSRALTHASDGGALFSATPFANVPSAIPGCKLPSQLETWRRNR